MQDAVANGSGEHPHYTVTVPDDTNSGYADIHAHHPGCRVHQPDGVHWQPVMHGHSERVTSEAPLYVCTCNSASPGDGTRSPPTCSIRPTGAYKRDSNAKDRGRGLFMSEADMAAHFEEGEGEDIVLTARHARVTSITGDNEAEVNMLHSQSSETPTYDVQVSSETGIGRSSAIYAGPDKKEWPSDPFFYAAECINIDAFEETGREKAATSLRHVFALANVLRLPCFYQTDEGTPCLKITKERYDEYKRLQNEVSNTRGYIAKEWVEIVVVYDPHNKKEAMLDKEWPKWNQKIRATKYASLPVNVWRTGEGFSVEYHPMPFAAVREDKTTSIEFVSSLFAQHGKLVEILPEMKPGMVMTDVFRKYQETPSLTGTLAAIVYNKTSKKFTVHTGSDDIDNMCSNECHIVQTCFHIRPLGHSVSHPEKSMAQKIYEAVPEKDRGVTEYTMPELAKLVCKEHDDDDIESKRRRLNAIVRAAKRMGGKEPSWTYGTEQMVPGSKRKIATCIVGNMPQSIRTTTVHKKAPAVDMVATIEAVFRENQERGTWMKLTDIVNGAIKNKKCYEGCSTDEEKRKRKDDIRVNIRRHLVRNKGGRDKKDGTYIHSLNVDSNTPVYRANFDL